MVGNWHPALWRQCEAEQIPDFTDAVGLAEVEARLRRAAPLVFQGEVESLRRHLARVARGQAFLLQGGDCAESFNEFSTDHVRDIFRVLLQMSVVLTFAAACPVIKVGRIAGQFAKPRSQATETQDGVTLPSYRGDIINGPEFSPSARTPDPQRQLRAYSQSAATLNLLRALSHGGYADLHDVQQWTMGFVRNSPQGDRYLDMAERIADCLRFMEACGINADSNPQIRQTEFYVSHEALLLGYEESLTRRETSNGSWYAASAHMLWVGERTRQIDGAHVAYLAGLANPIGAKVGPGLEPDALLRLVDRLDPERVPGRLTLITRMGADTLPQRLPALVRALQSEGHMPVWSCDPMHGNTVKTATGYKTRPFDRIVQEVQAFFEIHVAEGSHPGGLHLELTGRDVTECTGGAQAIADQDLSNRYDTYCDPRLNASQGLELAFRVAQYLKARGPHNLG